MSRPIPPQDLDGWKIEILNDLIKIPTIEGETFDFKGREMGDLDESICAMANRSGGVLILGVDDIREGKYLIRFEKKPFRKEEGDNMNNKIWTFVHKVEPLPNVTLMQLNESDRNFPDGSFYIILKVEIIIKNRPYMLNGRCYIRIGSTNQRADRGTIIDLCKHTIDRSTGVTHLKYVSGMLKRQLEYILDQANRMNQGQESRFFLPLIDLSFFKQAGANCTWFLTEYDLITEHPIGGSGSGHGFYSSINVLEELNSGMNRFNIEQMNAGNRNSMFLNWYRPWESIHMQNIINYFTKIIDSANDFLSS